MYSHIGKDEGPSKMPEFRWEGMIMRTLYINLNIIYFPLPSCQSDQLRQNLIIKQHFLEVDIAHLAMFDEALSNKLKDKPAYFLPLVKKHRARAATFCAYLTPLSIVWRRCERPGNSIRTCRKCKWRASLPGHVAFRWKSFTDSRAGCKLPYPSLSFHYLMFYPAGYFLTFFTDGLCF